jgi:glutamate synthase (NADPH/NADH) large chain/glutamate synthase (ferredoxin)
MTTHSTPPQADGLYDPRYEHDACGVAMVAKLDNAASHEVVVRALEALDNLEHRGAEGADTRTGDGAGILTQLPDAFLRSVVDFELPPAGRYGVGMCFLPQDPQRRAKIEQLLELNVRVEGQHVLGWRDVPVDLDHVGDTAARSRPYIRQLFVEAGPGTSDDQMAFERKLYVIRRIVELATGPDFYAPSFSSRTLVYKGMLISHQLRRYFPDLQNPAFASAMALVHSRFSTNTFPSWELSHPYRVIAHNGEINTLMGNKNWMRARESQLASELFGRDLNKVIPIVREGGSDSATFDNVLELLMLAGRSLPHAVMMMIPEAYAGRDDLPEHLKGFYAFHSCFMEPWDGPAAVCFTDGRVVGATLDRNGLRPGRWMETHDGYVILGSEAGMLAVPPERVKRLGRLAPGKLFLVDLGEGRIVEDEEVKEQVATAQPYGRWYADHVVHFDDLPEREPTSVRRDPLHVQQQAFGWTQEDLRVLLAPMAGRGEEPIGSMGNDAALAVLSDQRPALFNYFKQLFAQVTNPPIDPIREAVVMSLATGVGAEGNLLDEAPDHARQIAMEQPILRNHELETLRQIEHPAFRAHTIDITWPAAEGPSGLTKRLANACDEAYDAIRAGVNILILSDRRIAADRVPIPSLLAVAAVHHHLVREGNRLQAGPRPRVGRARGDPPLRDAHRVRRERDQPVPHVRVARRPRRHGPRGGRRRRRRRGAQRRQGRRQGPAQDDLQDGDLDGPVLQRRADLRGRRPGPLRGGPPLHRHRLADRRHRPADDRRRGARPPLARLPVGHGAPAGGRRLRLAAGRRAPHVEPGVDRAAPARGAVRER